MNKAQVVQAFKNGKTIVLFGSFGTKVFNNAFSALADFESVLNSGVSGRVL